MNDPRLTFSQGNYQPQIDQFFTDTQINDNGNILFICQDGPSGVIKFKRRCRDCIDNGVGREDACHEDM